MISNALPVASSTTDTFASKRLWSGVCFVFLHRSSHLLLFNRIDELLEGVSHELQVFEPGELTFFNARVDREESSLVDFLRLDECLDPAFLACLERLDQLSLMQQVFLVLAKVLSAHVLDLAQLLVVLVLEGLSVRLGSLGDVVN